MNHTAIDIVKRIREISQIETNREKWAVKILVSLADSAFKYGNLTAKQTDLLDIVCREHLLGIYAGKNRREQNEQI